MAELWQPRIQWNDEREALLRKLWDEGFTASQCAAQLGGGVTRNAVIGKINHLGLVGRKIGISISSRKELLDDRRRQTVKAQIIPKVKADPPMQPRPFVPREIPKDIPAPDPGLQVTILELQPTHCRWPIGDPHDENFRFCGGHAPSEDGPYCAFHHRLAYEPARKRPPMSEAGKQNIRQGIARSRAQRMASYA